MATHRWTPAAPVWGHVGPDTNGSVAGKCAQSGEMGCLFISVIRLEVGQTGEWSTEEETGEGTHAHTNTQFVKARHSPLNDVMTAHPVSSIQVTPNRPHICHHHLHLFFVFKHKLPQIWSPKKEVSKRQKERSFWGGGSVSNASYCQSRVNNSSRQSRAISSVSRRENCPFVLKETLFSGDPNTKRCPSAWQVPPINEEQGERSQTSMQYHISTIKKK